MEMVGVTADDVQKTVKWFSGMTLHARNKSLVAVIMVGICMLLVVSYSAPVSLDALEGCAKEMEKSKRGHE